MKKIFFAFLLTMIFLAEGFAEITTFPADEAGSLFQRQVLDIPTRQIDVGQRITDAAKNLQDISAAIYSVEAILYPASDMLRCLLVEARFTL